MPEKVIHEIRLNQYIACPADRTRRFSLGTRDSYGVEQLRIVPGEGWDGLAITATFHAPDGEAVQVIVPADGLIDVPPEATRSGSELPIKYGKIVFAGVADGVQRISCNLPYTVMDHAPVDGAASSGPSPSWYEQAAAHFVPSGGKSGQVLAKASDADLDVEWADGGNGTADHAKLSNRDASDQHPISAITGLETALDAKQPSGDYLTADTLQAATDAALAQAKESGEFDGEQGPKGVTPNIQVGTVTTLEAGSAATASMTGTAENPMLNLGIPKGADGQPGADGKDGLDGSPGADGKSAYQYAVEGGYTGTEEAFAAKLAQELPTTLPNPNALTFTGAVTGSYDGSEPVTVEIPSSGSGGSSEETWRLIKTIEITEEVASISFDLDDDGNPFEVESLLIYAGPTVTTSGSSQFMVQMNGNNFVGSLNSFVGTTAKSIYWETHWAGLRVAVMGSTTYDFKRVASTAGTVILSDAPQKITSVKLLLQSVTTFTAGKFYVYGR